MKKFNNNFKDVIKTALKMEILYKRARHIVYLSDNKWTQKVT